MPDAPARVELSELTDRPFISLAGSGPIGTLLTDELDRLGLELTEVVAARTFYIAAGLVRAGVGVTVVWTALVSAVAYKLVDLLIGLRVKEDAEREGLDVTSHGEKAYSH